MKQKGNETKNKILTIALQLIKEKGYDEVTLNDICQAAGISKHTFYYYFASKEQILLQFYTIPRDIASSRLAAILATESSLEQLWQLMEPIIEFFEDCGAEITKRVLIANLTRDTKTFESPRVIGSMFDAQISLVKKGKEAGEIRNQTNPQELLETIFHAFMGLVNFWCISNGGFSLKAATRGTFEVILDIPATMRSPRTAHSPN